MLLSVCYCAPELYLYPLSLCERGPSTDTFLFVFLLQEFIYNTNIEGSSGTHYNVCAHLRRRALSYKHEIEGERESGNSCGAIIMPLAGTALAAKLSSLSLLCSAIHCVCVCIIALLQREAKKHGREHA